DARECATNADCTNSALCITGVCRALCDTVVDCPINEACVASVCVPEQGEACSLDDPCETGFACVDDTCRPLLGVGSSCEEDLECRSDACNGGVCCGRACGAACESCLEEETGLSTGECGFSLPGLNPEERCGSVASCNDAGACVPFCDGEFEILNDAMDGCIPAYRVQVVHASADPSIATLDVYRGNTLLEDDLAFGSATGVVKIPVTEGLVIAAADSADASVPLLTDIPISTGRFLAIVRGLSGSDFDTTVNDTALTLDLIELREAAVGDAAADLLFYNAVTDSTSLGVGRQEAPNIAPDTPFFDDVEYGTSSPYESGPPGTTAYDVYVQDGGMRIKSVQTSSGDLVPSTTGLEDGSATALIATGFLEPAANRGGTAQNGAEFEILSVFPDGSVGVLDSAARIQFVHAAVAAPPTVDVYFALAGQAELGELIVNNLAYQNATPFRSYVSGVPIEVQLTDGGSTELAASSSHTTEQNAGRMIAIGVPGSSSAPLTTRYTSGTEQRQVSDGYRFQGFGAVVDFDERRLDLREETLSYTPCDSGSVGLFGYSTQTSERAVLFDNFALGFLADGGEPDFFEFPVVAMSKFADLESLFGVLTGEPSNLEFLVIDTEGFGLVSSGIQDTEVCE
ncbi:MAG: hypothetical protein AAFY60_07605, partial [Myxococcota bacterium]